MLPIIVEAINFDKLGARWNSIMFVAFNSRKF